MTPTSPLAGLLTGLVDGGVVVALTLLIAHIYGRRTEGQPAQVHAVAEDDAPRIAGHTRLGELPKD